MKNSKNNNQIKWHISFFLVIIDCFEFLEIIFNLEGKNRAERKIKLNLIKRRKI